MEYYSVLKSVGLFKGVSEDELYAMLKCLGSEIKAVKKGEIMLLAGDTPKHIGIVLSGLLHITREDSDGNRAIIAAAAQGGIFAEALCCAGVSESPVTVVADARSVVMLLKFSRILRVCPKACGFHSRLIENMLGLIANKNLQLQDRMEIIGMKSVRAKILRYLEGFSQRRGAEFTIPFNREEMADFLCVERSALSHELAKMKRDGLIDYRKNRFAIKTKPPSNFT